MNSSFFKRLGLTGDGHNGSALLSPGFLLRFALSAALIGFLVWWLPTDILLASFSRIPFLHWVAVVCAFLAVHSVAAMKWRMLLLVVGVHTSILTVLRGHAAGLFANLCLPTIVGGDFVRAAIVARGGSVSLTSVAIGSLADRLNDTLALVLISAGGAWYLSSSTVGDSFQILDYGLLKPIAITMVVMVLLPLAALICLPVKIWPKKLRRTVDSAGQAAELLLKNPATGVLALLLSVVIQLLLISLNILLAMAIGLSAQWALWFFAWPLAKLVSLLPISLGGLGVRDAALLTLLTPHVAIPALVVAQSLSWQAVLIISGVLAGALTAFYPWPAPSSHSINNRPELIK